MGAVLASGFRKNQPQGQPQQPTHQPPVQPPPMTQPQAQGFGQQFGGNIMSDENALMQVIQSMYAQDESNPFKIRRPFGMNQNPFAKNIGIFGGWPR